MNLYHPTKLAEFRELERIEHQRLRNAFERNYRLAKAAHGFKGHLPADNYRPGSRTRTSTSCEVKLPDGGRLTVNPYRVTRS